MRRLSIIGLVVTAVAARLLAEPSVVTLRALRVARETPGGYFRADENNNLFIWDPPHRVAYKIAPDGRQTTSGTLPEAGRVDFDATRGIALLSQTRRLTIASWNGHVLAHIDMKHPAGDVAWLEGDQVAVSPLYAPHRVEVWDVATKRLVRAIGPCLGIMPPREGAKPARATLLRYLPQRREIATLDAYEGEMNVYSVLTGRLRRQAHLPHPDRAGIDRWLLTRDTEAHLQHVSTTPLLWLYPHITATPDGTLWVGEKSDNKHSVSIVRVTVDGSVARSAFEQPDCPAIRFETWGEAFIIYRPVLSPLSPCVAIRRR